MKFKDHFATLLLLSATMQASAQNQDEAAAMEQRLLLEEVIVTAQHRAQDERDVPIVITALHTETLDRYFQGGDDIRALATRVTSLHAESSNGRVAPRFYIRGLGNTDFDLASSQPVSVIMDDVVQENVVLKSFPLFDVERIEVLKGPQGTLYGRNTPAGIIKINTRAPRFESDGYINVSQSIGRVQGTQVQWALGGRLLERLAGRLSAHSHSRQNWIANDYPNAARETFGAIEDHAIRGQLLWTPTDRMSLHFGLRARDYEAYPAVFRANVIGPFNDQLNENLTRNRVYYDESSLSATFQGYESFAVSLRAEFELERLNLTITSITGYAEANGTSRGDVDGGAVNNPALDGTMNPVPVPFPAFTGDGLSHSNQLTEEFRVAYAGGRFNAQVGLFLFANDFTILTERFPGETAVRHENEAWGLFGQVSFNIAENFEITGGLRLTNDDKTLNFVRGAQSSAFQEIELSGEDLSWEGAFLYQASDYFNFFGRVAHGFRAPSIQARSVAFGDAPSTADSENITSVEGGIKFALPEKNLRFNASMFYYTVKDQQFTAVGGENNNLQLINAEEGRGEGLELNLEWRPYEWLGVSVGYSLNKTEIVDPSLRVPICSGGCSVTDPTEVVTTATGTTSFALVNGNPFPNAPRYTLFYGVNITHGTADGGQIFFNSDYAKQGRTNFFLYESEEFTAAGDFELGLELGYRTSNNRFQLSVFSRNVTNEANLRGGVDFNNVSGFLNEPRIVGVRIQVNSL